MIRKEVNTLWNTVRLPGILIIASLLVAMAAAQSGDINRPDGDHETTLVIVNAQTGANGKTTAQSRQAISSDSTRSLAEYYARRAYPGAPPLIPHELSDPDSYGGRACNRCHERSRYVSRFGAYTPLTPHPELLSCRSCHALPVVADSFVESDWIVPDPPVLVEEHEADVPPDIPHMLQLRTNCLACHSGPGSVPEIRTPHPEEDDCLACHEAVLEENG